jgi:prevent-host-death family protein
MLSTKHTQSLSDFRQNATETLKRLNKTGQAEILTVNGEARAVLISPSAYDELTQAREAEIERDVAAIRRSMKEIEQGKVLDLETAFADIRAQLLSMKSKQGAGK